jgi:mono/diheme cytochrome c family protein
MFDASLDEGALAKLPALVRVNDRSAPLEHRVRSYLDANCAQCHRPNGAAGYFDARFDTPLAEQGLIHGRLAKTMDIAGAEVVCPGDVSRSVLYQRVHMTGELQMPPLARNQLDQDALDVLGEWIKGLAPEGGR